MRLDRGSGLLCGVVIGVRLCLPSGLAAGVGIGVVEAELCFIRGSGLGVRAVSARSRAARARASGDEGSEEEEEEFWFVPTLHGTREYLKSLLLRCQLFQFHYGIVP